MTTAALTSHKPAVAHDRKRLMKQPARDAYVMRGADAGCFNRVSFPGTCACQRGSMNTPLSPDTGNRREPCYGADIAEYGSIVVAEYRDGIAATACRYPAVTDGAAALRERIGRTSTRVRVCIRSCGAAALSVAVALMARSTAEVTLIAPRAVASFGRARPSAAPFGTAESARAAGEAPDMSVVVLQVCPVCNREHRVAPARAEFAYGHQLACGPDCEAERRRRLRAVSAPAVPGFGVCSGARDHHHGRPG